MPPAREVDRNNSGQRSADREIAALAGAQHWVLSRRQLIGMGLTRDEIDYRVAIGRLHPLHRGVYAVGHRVMSVRGRWMAAALAGGPSAVLSHRSAAALWGIRRSEGTRIEVTVPAARRSRPGVRYRRGRIAGDEMTTHDGIPVTTPGRTLVDLAAILSVPNLRRAVEQAEILRLDSGLPPDAVVQRHATRPGVRRLREVLEDGVAQAVTRSELEDRFLAFIDAAGLPRPKTNYGIEGIEADCAWPDSRLIVELDGRAFHDTRVGFERDRERDRRLQAAGWRVVRVTWRQLQTQPAAVRRDLRKLLRPA